MKRSKSFLFRLPIYLVLVAVVGTGLWNYLMQIKLPEQLQEALATQPPTIELETPPEELEDNILCIGDHFSLYPSYATGHLDCRVTSAGFVTDEADCPRDWLTTESYLNIYDEEHGPYYYDEWFLPGGPLEQGARLVRIELEITNVDAVANVQEGSFHPDVCNVRYKEPDLFDGFGLLSIADLSTMDKEGNFSYYHTALFSETGKYSSEDDRETMGDERYALKLAPGETKYITIIFSIPSTYEQTAKNPKYLFLWNYRSIEQELQPYQTDRSHHQYISLNLEDTP